MSTNEVKETPLWEVLVLWLAILGGAAFVIALCVAGAHGWRPDVPWWLSWLPLPPLPYYP